MTEGELLLTDEFLQFSGDIAALIQEKKTLKDDFKKVYEEFQTKLKSVDQKADKRSKEFDEWKKSKTKDPVPHMEEPPKSKTGKK